MNARLEKIAESGLTVEKVAADRQNAFDIGITSYIDEVGMDKVAEENFRTALNASLAAQLSNAAE